MEKYIEPSIVVLGTVSELTQGTQNGNLTDAAFPNDTPRGDLTFS